MIDLAILSILVLFINLMFLFERQRIGAVIGVVSLLIFVYSLTDTTLPAQPVSSIFFIIVAIANIGFSLTASDEVKK